MATLTNEQMMSQLYAAYGTAGGAESQTPLVIGGLDGVKDYANTIMSKAKDKLIRDIARDMKAKFRIEGKGAAKVDINPDADLDTLIAQLKKAIPNPSKNGRVFSSKLGTQTKACKTLAQIVNNNFGFAKGSGIIDENADPDEICEKVSEVMYTLFTGMHGEFLGVRADAERLLKNLHHLHEILQRNYNQLMSKMSTADPENIMAETKLARDGHQAILKEMTRQQTMLENMMNVVVSPADRKLAELLKETQDYKRLVKDIKKLPGSGKFGEKLSYVLSGIGTTAQMAQSVDSALKTIQMSAAEYGRQKDLKDLEETVFDKLQAKMKGNASEESLREYIKAARTLFRYDYKRPEIVKELGRTGSAEDQDVDGGASRIQGGLKLDKRVKRRQELRKQLVNAFNRRLSVHLENILASTKALAKATGTTVPITDALRTFTDRLELIPDLNKRHIYYALTGYYRDPASKEERERFVANVKSLMSALEGLKNVEYAKDLLKEWQGVVTMIEEFSSQFEKGFGPLKGKVSPEYPPEYEGRAEETEETEGGDLEDDTPSFRIAGGPQIAHLADTLEQSKNIMRFFYRAASVRHSLKKAGPEMKSYGEDYEKVLGDAVARARDKITKEQKLDLEALREGANALPNYPYQALKTELRGNDRNGQARAQPLPENDPDVKQTLEKLAKTREKYYDTKIGMLKCAEAMDLYMKHFTDGIVNNIEDVQKVETMLRGTDIISQWFTNNAGNLVCSVFDTHPGFYVHDTPYWSNLQYSWKRGDAWSNKVHYYWRVQAVCRLIPLGAANGSTAGSARENLENMVRRAPDLKDTYKAASDDDKDWTLWFTGGQINDGTGAVAAKAGNTTAIGGGKSIKTADAQLHAAINNVNVANNAAGNDRCWGPTNVGIPGVPYLGIPMVDDEVMFQTTSSADQIKYRNVDKAMEFITKAFENVSVLKNIVAAFVSIGDRFGGDELRKKTHMSPIQIYNSLINYMTVGSFSFGLADPAGGHDSENTAFNSIGGPAAGQQGANHTFVDANHILSGVTGEGADVATAGLQQRRRHGFTGMRKAKGVAITQINDAFKNALAGNSGDTIDTDGLFVMVIKAMVAKVLTVIGVYNMLHRPIDRNTLGYYSPTRFTLGGSDLGTPKIIPEALELYIRLPLLAEFYRELFRFEHRENNDVNPTLSMIPEMDGTFQGLVELIFDYAKHVKFGTYSENDVRTIIQEVNKIYMGSKGANVTMDVIHEFIAEINRRYGVLVKTERSKYQDDIDRRYRERYESMDAESRADFEILPDEEDNYPRPGPSDSYVTQSGTWKETTHKWEIRNEHVDFIKNLRSAIEKEFSSIENAQDLTKPALDSQEKLKYLSFDNLIKARTEELKSAKSDKEKFNVVMQAINGLGEFSMNAQERSLILFHETVVTGLNTLTGLYKMVEQFRRNVFLMAGNVDGVMNWAANRAAANRTEANLIVDIQTALGKESDSPKYRYAGGTVVVFKGSNGIPHNVNENFRQADLFAQTILNDDDQTRDIARRFGINHNKMMVDLIEGLFGHCASLDGLIECQIEVIDHPMCNSRGWVKTMLESKSLSDADRPKSLAISIDHSKLIEFVEKEFYFLKTTMDKFRGLIPKDVINAYEAHKDKKGADQIGSLYWLEKHFLQQTLAGKMEGWHDRHLARVNDKLRTITEWLFMPWQFNAQGLHNGGALANYGWEGITQTNNAEKQWYDQNNYYGAMNFLVKWNPYSYTLGAQTNIAVGPGATPPGLRRLLHKPTIDPANPIVAHAGPIYDDVDASLHALDYQRGVLFMFNKFLAAYIHQFYDSQSEKIYINCINNFANGAFSDPVMNDNKSLNDGMAVADLARFDDVPNALTKSLAVMFRNLLTGRLNQKTYKHFLETDLAEIPLFMKENYKANMPVFTKMFTYLIHKCKLLKSFVEAAHTRNEGIYAKGTDAAARAGAAPITDQHRGEATLAAVEEKEGKKRLHQVLDQVIVGSQAILNCINEVLEELADAPVYLETHKDSIKEYEAANGRKPLMPMSSILYYLQNTTAGHHDPNTPDKAMPRFKMGTNEFSLLYGTRGVLMPGGDASLAKMPGMKDILQKHNETTESEHHLDEKSLSEHMNVSVNILRYLTDNLHYKALLSVADDNGHHIWWRTAPNGAGAAAPTASAVGPAGAANDELFNHMRTPLQAVNLGDAGVAAATAVYSLGEKLLEVVQITTSANSRESRQKLVRRVETSDKTIIRGTRQQIRVMNIIDMNVVPVNINALMREIPLVNLYNYSYTFDTMISDLLGIDQDIRNATSMVDNAGDTGAIDISRYPPHERARKALGWMLMNPYGDMDWNAYQNYFSRIVRGAIGIEGLGRPKFLGDELYNKALFGEVYADITTMDEAGPAVGHGRQAGLLTLTEPFMRDILLRVCASQGAAEANRRASARAVGQIVAAVGAINHGGAANLGTALHARFAAAGGTYNTLAACMDVIWPADAPHPLAAVAKPVAKLEAIAHAVCAVGQNANVNAMVAWLDVAANLPGVKAVYDMRAAGQTNDVAAFIDPAEDLVLEGSLRVDDVTNAAGNYNPRDILTVDHVTDHADANTIADVLADVLQTQFFNDNGTPRAAPARYDAGHDPHDAVLNAGGAGAVGGVINVGDQREFVLWFALLLGLLVHSASRGARLELAFIEKALRAIPQVRTNDAGIAAIAPFNTALLQPMFVGNPVGINSPLLAARLPITQAILKRAQGTPADLPNVANAGTYLSYMHSMPDGKGELVQVQVGNFKPMLQRIGFLRFSTFYCRSLIWLTNIQRVLRLKLRRDLHWYNEKIVRENAVMAPGITELYGNDTAFYSQDQYRY